MVHDNQHGAMDKDTIQRRTQNRQVHPPRDPADLERIGEHAAFAHVGPIVAAITRPLLAEHELEQALRAPAGIRLEFYTEAAELVSR